MEGRLYTMKNLLPLTGMVMAILAQTGNLFIVKFAMSGGMNKYILILYSNALSTIILLPCSFMLHRSEHPPLSFSLLCSFLLLDLFGCSAQIVAYVGLNFSSPILFTAMNNLVPAFTFVLN
ncbi:WAT1-related protein [Quillaja saponaria]|uniref:WAT1-related protein n=1 Tax=Quillaja saponaria TaxID=32244 RepID=A0AAD7KQ31_QUISA|nr:WAT1-related protein [Quillaja saponaria]